MKTIKKILLIILLIAGYTSAILSQNLDSIPQPERDSLLISVAKETIRKYGPGYYRDPFKKITIERLTDSSLEKSSVNRNPYADRVAYIVTFFYDDTKEQLDREFLARVHFWADEEGKPGVIDFGNRYGVILYEVENGLRNDEDIVIHYTPLPKSIWRKKTDGQEEEKGEEK